MKRNKAIFFVIISLLIFKADFSKAGSGTPTYDWEEGKYAGANTENHNSVLAAFGQHFNMNQFYYISNSTFSTNNDARVDMMDLGYYVGHGSWHRIETNQGQDFLDLEHAGSDPYDEGYGDLDLEYLVLHACNVVASEIEEEYWWVPWSYDDSDDVFDGIHYILGFRTYASMSNDQYIANCFGGSLKLGGTVTQSWMDCIDMFGDGTERGSILIAHNHPWGETYANNPDIYVPDPLKNNLYLDNWYQF